MQQLSSCWFILRLPLVQMLFGIKSRFKNHRAEQMDALQVGRYFKSITAPLALMWLAVP